MVFVVGFEGPKARWPASGDASGRVKWFRDALEEKRKRVEHHSVFRCIVEAVLLNKTSSYCRALVLMFNLRLCRNAYGSGNVIV